MRGLIGTLGGLAAMGIAGPALGGVINGGFETGDLTGWTSSGPVAAVTSEFVRDPGFAPPSAFVPAGSTWLPFVSGADATYFGSLWSTDGIDNSSSLSQTFSGNAGDTLKFRYFLDFGETDDIFSDRLWGELDRPTLGTLSFFDVTRNDEENFDWALVTYVLPETGSYTLRFGAEEVDPFSYEFESVLGIDNVSLTDGGNVIPLPSAAGLGGLGLLITASRRRTRTR